MYKIFSCEKCNYNTSDKGNYSKHLLTLKHKKLHNLEINMINMEQRMNQRYQLMHKIFLIIFLEVCKVCLVDLQVLQACQECLVDFQI